MLSVSGTLAAALTAAVRRPILSALVDWLGSGTTTDTYDDLSKYVESVSIDRSVTTDLPAEANIVEGYASAQATVKFGGKDPSLNDLASVFSPANGVLLGTSRRLNTVITLTLGAVTDLPGPEYLPAFIGRVRTLSVDDANNVTVTALDGPERLRTAITLPVFVAYDPLTFLGPGLNSQWVIDRILRLNGFYSSPGPRNLTRPGAVVYLDATMHGSAWPHPNVSSGAQAVLTYASTTNAAGLQGQMRFQPHDDGLIGQQYPAAAFLPVGYAPNSEARYALGAGLNMNQGSSIYVQFRARRFGANLVSTALFTLADTYGSGVWRIIVTMEATGGGTRTLTCNVTRNSAAGFATLTYPTMLPDVDHRIGLQFTFTATGYVVQAEMDGVTQSATGTVGNPTGSPSMLSFSSFLANGGVKSEFQVTSEPYVVGMFDTTFTPTAKLQAGLNELTAMPAVEDRQPWPLLQEIVEAEQGVLLFDEAGVVQFYNNAKMTGDATATATVSSTRSLRSIALQEQIDSVRNIIRVPATAPGVDPANVIVWTASETLMVPRSGSLTVPVDLPGALYSLDTSFIYLSGAIDASAGSGYRAAQNSDGTGGNVSNLSVTVRTYPSRIEVVIANPNAFDVWLVNNSLGGAAAGQSLLNVVGRLIRLAANPVAASVNDATSRAAYGDQALDVSDNPWRQSAASAASLAALLLSRLKDPHPVLTGVQVVSDPRVQLTDRVTLVEPERTGVIRDYYVVGKTDQFSADGGLTQTYDLRDAGPATTGMTGLWLVGSTTQGFIDSVWTVG